MASVTVSKNGGENEIWSGNILLTNWLAYLYGRIQSPRSGIALGIEL